MALAGATVENKRWVLTKRPKGAFDPARDARYESISVELSAVPEDKVVVQVDTVSVDAFVRTMLDDTAYHGAIQLGDVIPAIGYGTVVAAGTKSGRKVGQRVIGMVGAQTFATLGTKGEMGVMPFMKIPFQNDRTALGLFGLTTGFTAYVGLFCAPPKGPSKGETVLISAASGAVGHIAAQLAKATGARVIGIAGGEKKQEWLLDVLGLDAAIDYKSQSQTLAEQLDQVCPNGVDFFFDNVGGDTLDEVLLRMRPKGRVVICGAVSQYSGNLNVGKVQGPSNYLKLAEIGCSMTGFNVMQYMSSLPKAAVVMLYYKSRGYLKCYEQVEKGVQSFPGALVKMFTGGHCGKMLCDISDSGAADADVKLQLEAAPEKEEPVACL